MANTALVKKLGIKVSQKVLILNAPKDYLQTLGKLPEGVEVKTVAGGTFDVVQLFVHSKAELDNLAAIAIRAVKHGGLLWFTYPKKSSSIKTDITRDIGWDIVMNAGLRPVALVAIDDTWSALRFRLASEVKSSPRS